MVTNFKRRLLSMGCGGCVECGPILLVAMSGPQDDPEPVLASLAKVLESPLFTRAHRQSAFLRYIVENVLAGNTDALKEYQIGLQVYQRGPAYDTRADPIVRVEASRLRSKLREYYSTLGQSDPVQIELPKGTYVPVFHRRVPAAPPVPPPLPLEPAAPVVEPAGFRLSRGVGLLLAAVLGLAALAYWWSRRQAPSPAEGMPRSIAIVPFRDLSGKAGGRELCDALAETLTEELSRVNGLLVAGRTSTLRLSDRTTDLQALGRQLNVGAVLEGSVQAAGEQVRVRARLFDVVSGFQLWSGTFDRTQVEAFAVQDEIAHAIASTLRLQLGRPREDPSAKLSLARRQSQELFNQGRELHRKADPALLIEARALHLRAVQADPRYPLAHSGLAHINITVMSEGLRPPSELRAETVKAIETALTLDPELSDAYSARVRLSRDIDMDWPMVETTCRDVTRLFPNAASIRGNCGLALALMGRFPQAEEELRACVRLDPLWPSGLDNLAWMLYLSGRQQDALRQVEELMRMDPAFRGSRRTYSRILLGAGRFSQARTYLEAELRNSPQATELWALLGFARGRLGDKPGALECLSHLGARPHDGELALVHLGLGDQAQAAAHLERALDKHETLAVDILVDPALRIGAHTPRLRAKVKL